MLSGPMFESNEGSLFKKRGSHYNIYEVKSEQGMATLRNFFPDGKADDLNFVLFSTSGIHGSYLTIEEIEDGDELTFLIVHPRLVCIRFGTCVPKTPEDFEFLQKLRQSSWEAVGKIGKHEEDL